jgi:hypothetical protein
MTEPIKKAGKAVKVQKGIAVHKPASAAKTAPHGIGTNQKKR